MIRLLPIISALALAGCNSGPAQPEAEPQTPLSDLNVNSAKRQCVSVAVLQQVPDDAAKGICDCTVETLMEKGQFTADTMPSDAQQQAALDACIAEYTP